jgi:hypothetical protein
VGPSFLNNVNTSSKPLNKQNSAKNENGSSQFYQYAGGSPPYLLDFINHTNNQLLNSSCLQFLNQQQPNLVFIDYRSNPYPFMIRRESSTNYLTPNKTLNRCDLDRSMDSVGFSENNLNS